MDNILINSKAEVKICDFGISKRMHPDKTIYEKIGTPAYLAPEVIEEKGYKGCSADIWSLGVMTFICLTGLIPFKGKKMDHLYNNILSKEIDFSKTNLSNKMKRIISSML